MTKEKFIQMCKDQLFTEKELIDVINQVLSRGGMNLNELPEDDFKPVHALLGAIYEKQASYCLEGASNIVTKRMMRRKANQLKAFFH